MAIKACHKRRSVQERARAPDAQAQPPCYLATIPGELLEGKPPQQWI